jgi:peptidylprolyl isomerase
VRRSPLAAVVTAALVVAGCGSGDGDEDVAATATTTPEISLVPATAPPPVPVPSVDLPEAVPEELRSTTLIEGTGRAAEAGDAVLVRYVGVSNETGEVFDENYNGEPFSLTLGEGGVIRGWDEGLLGVRTGEQRQLDIPADLAYGPTPTTEAGATTVPGGRPTGPLTFVVDVVAVVPPVDPATEPTEEDIPVSDTPATAVVTEDLVEGDGPTVDIGMTALLHFVLARGDNGVILRSTWDQGAPSQLILAPSGQMDGLVEGLVGMRVGGRRVITVPYELAFGEEGFPQAGLPARTDAVVVVDLVAAY